jgi:hypothetical protein
VHVVLFAAVAKTIGRIPHLPVDYHGENFKSSFNDYQGRNFITHTDSDYHFGY